MALDQVSGEVTEMSSGRAARLGAGDPDKREVGARAAELISQGSHWDGDGSPSPHCQSTERTSTGSVMPLSSILRGLDP